MSYDSQFVFVKGELDNPVAAVSFMNSSMTLLNAVMSSPTEKNDGSNAMVWPNVLSKPPNWFPADGRDERLNAMHKSQQQTTRLERSRDLLVDGDETEIELFRSCSSMIDIALTAL